MAVADFLDRFLITYYSLPHDYLRQACVDVVLDTSSHWWPLEGPEREVIAMRLNYWVTLRKIVAGRAQNEPMTRLKARFDQDMKRGLLGPVQR